MGDEREDVQRQRNSSIVTYQIYLHSPMFCQAESFTGSIGRGTNGYVTESFVWQVIYSINTFIFFSFTKYRFKE